MILNYGKSIQVKNNLGMSCPCDLKSSNLMLNVPITRKLMQHNRLYHALLNMKPYCSQEPNSTCGVGFVMYLVKL
jgi:hypothetical protein